MSVSNLLDACLIFAGMKRNQWKSRGELEAIQEEKLRRIVAYARKNVPHYKKTLGGFSLRSLEDLQALPIAEKEDLKHAPSSFISRERNISDMHPMRTGGSTGMPLTIYFDNRDSIYGLALRYHVLTECGFGPADLLAVITHSQFVPTPPQRFLYRIRRLSPSDEESRLLSELKGIRPDMLFAYPSTLALLAGLNRKSGHPLRVRKAISSSERLTASDRALITGSLGCSIRNYYGSNESWAIACECGNGSMHINSDSVIIEVVGKDGLPVREGGHGEVLITSLWRYSMPFIRYRIGDLASLGGKCRCGRGLHILSSLDGRNAEMIRLPSGKPFPWAKVTIALGNISGLLRYQGIQESGGNLRIKAIPLLRGRLCSISEVRKTVLAALPEEMEVEVEFVNKIPRTTSGKMRDFISKLNPEK